MAIQDIEKYVSTIGGERFEQILRSRGDILDKVTSLIRNFVESYHEKDATRYIIGHAEPERRAEVASALERTTREIIDYALANAPEVKDAEALRIKEIKDAEAEIKRLRAKARESGQSFLDDWNGEAGSGHRT